jgi:hypothetical protein
MSLFLNPRPHQSGDLFFIFDYKHAHDNEPAQAPREHQ